jgi:hypothetical protein
MPVFLGLAWGATILGKLAVIVLAIRRRIPAPLFVLFFLAHTARSLYMSAFLSGEAYSRFRVASLPWFNGFAALVAVEAFVLLCWRLPRFRWYGAALFAVVSVVGGAAAVGSEILLPWQTGTRVALIARTEQASGLLLCVALLLSVLVMSRFRAVDEGAQNHAAALALQAMSAFLAPVVAQSWSPYLGSLVSTLGTLAAYVMWCWTVRRLRVDREKPGGPLDPGEVERAWGASA